MRDTPPPHAAATPTHIDFYLDFISPFGYLARGRLLRLAQSFQLSIAYHPVEIGAIKRAAGNTGPSNRAIPAKLAYLRIDYLRWAARYGIPMSADLPGGETEIFNRGMYLAMERGQADIYAEHAWNCIWRDALDPGAPASINELEMRMNWDRGELSAFASMPHVISRFHEEIQAASARGVFGVPTCMLGDQMWWGNDRLDFLEDHLIRTASRDLRAPTNRE